MQNELKGDVSNMTLLELVSTLYVFLCYWLMLSLSSSSSSSMLEKQEPESSSSSEEAQAVTPWVVSGNVDHEKVIEKFGCDRIDESLICVFDDSVFFCVFDDSVFDLH
ncbi:hypothetical protein Bca52824_081379 [Brassica carinata]|uniref:Uncharacterized protein n=1 Tax=Brassica carinata TaxID=52824 RepID=A0A8X7PIL2_BRACI|nr:hypothetical protein Bca52824_081379 [Brassica carinata]